MALDLQDYFQLSEPQLSALALLDTLPGWSRTSLGALSVFTDCPDMPIKFQTGVLMYYTRYHTIIPYPGTNNISNKVSVHVTVNANGKGRANLTVPSRDISSARDFHTDTIEEIVEWLRKFMES